MSSTHDTHDWDRSTGLFDDLERRRREAQERGEALEREVERWEGTPMPYSRRDRGNTVVHAVSSRVRVDLVPGEGFQAFVDGVSVGGVCYDYREAVALAFEELRGRYAPGSRHWCLCDERAKALRADGFVQRAERGA